MKSISSKVLILTLIAMPFINVAAQEGFGFDDSEFGFSSGSSFSVNISGEISAGVTGFFDDFSSAEKIGNIKPGDIFSGSLNFDASGSAAQGIINLNLIPVFDGTSPVEIDEAFVRAFFGPVTVEGGLRKLSWGKADSFGPLDVINPLDYTDLTRLSDPQSIKIARPMIHGIWSLGAFSRLEAVFVPTFQGHQFDMTGRWRPSQIGTLINELEPIMPYLPISGIEELYPDTSTLNYSQAGLRFTTTLGSYDFGFQYYFGRFNRPAVIFELVSVELPLPVPLPISVPLPDRIVYNSFHQIGLDFASVIAGFNLRAEAGVMITSDLDGKDGTVENPSLVWSLGFDRDLLWGINLNLQGSGSFRLFYDRIGDNLLADIEAGSYPSSTRITGVLSRTFLRDELELKVSGLWGIEDKDFLIMPAIVWSRNDVSTEFSTGFFGGDKKGELGQYRDNGFARLILSYKF